MPKPRMLQKIKPFDLDEYRRLDAQMSGDASHEVSQEDHARWQWLSDQRLAKAPLYREMYDRFIDRDSNVEDFDENYRLVSLAETYGFEVPYDLRED